ncbi:hypothetical protein HPG69_017363 [Diceros bicornis minor]|uniref:Uncharacterized protein n=1 Tax=Diceros bicornis minor TaxID=77932 RepID=A0A7J7EP98_DICBM|nr:hypothetical protein HPG69_017363 [Diceros bicornis minor]
MGPQASHQGLTQWVGGELPAVYLQGTSPKSSALGFLGCWGSWAPMGPWVSRGFQSREQSQRHQVRTAGVWFQHHVHLVICAPGPLLTNLPMPSPCREPAGCLPGLAAYQPVPENPQTLTLGFFTPLPLGCSSKSCRFRGLFSAGGVSTKLESWGSGVAFSPKGSDWWRETSRVATRASGSGVPHFSQPACTSSSANKRRTQPGSGLLLGHPSCPTTPPLPLASTWEVLHQADGLWRTGLALTGGARGVTQQRRFLPGAAVILIGHLSTHKGPATQRTKGCQGEQGRRSAPAPTPHHQLQSTEGLSDHLQTWRNPSSPVLEGRHATKEGTLGSQLQAPQQYAGGQLHDIIYPAAFRPPRIPQSDSAEQLKDNLYLRNQKNPPEGGESDSGIGGERGGIISGGVKELAKCAGAGAREGRATAGARAPSPPPKPSGGGLLGARAPAHRSGSAPRPAARSRPRAEATQSRSPTQRRWRRQQRSGPRGRSARALRAYLPHPGHQPGRPPAGLRWRRRQRRGKRRPRAESARGATAAWLRIPGPWRGSRRDGGFLGLLPARSGLEGTRLHVLLDRPFCRLRLALPSAAAAILCPGPGLRAAHALVPPLRDLAAAVPPS